MKENVGYYVVRTKAVPEVLLKVVETKNLLQTGKVATIQEAVELTGISRSSFYKYKDDIFPFHDNAEGKTITFTCEMEDEPGILSDVLRIIAEFGANILTTAQIKRCNRLVFNIFGVTSIDFVNMSSISTFKSFIDSHLYIQTPFSKWCTKLL